MHPDKPTVLILALSVIYGQAGRVLDSIHSRLGGNENQTSLRNKFWIVRDDIDISYLHATDTLMQPLPRRAGLSNACLKGAPLFGASQPALFAGDYLFLLAALT